MMHNDLNYKIQSAIKLIRAAAPADGSPIEVCYSGGKDSDVILALTKMANINYKAIYKNTTIDPPGTLSHCKNNGVEIVQPSETFFQLVRRHGMPTRRARFCCSILKEYKILDIAIQGIRRTESVKRAAHYKADDPIICRIYGKKTQQVSVILPILTWDNNDITQFIKTYDIKCHDLYYDDDGNFDPTKRLGCMGCPLKSDNGLSDFIKNPKLFRQLAKSVCIWWINHPNTKSREKFKSPYNLIAHNLLFNRYADYLARTYTLFGEEDWKSYLEKLIKIKLPDLESLENCHIDTNNSLIH